MNVNDALAVLNGGIAPLTAAFGTLCLLAFFFGAGRGPTPPTVPLWLGLLFLFGAADRAVIALLRNAGALACQTPDPLFWSVVFRAGAFVSAAALLYVSLGLWGPRHESRGRG